jgi:phage gpG-like protein
MSDELTADAPRLDQVVLELQQLGDGARSRLNAAVGELAEAVQASVLAKLSGQVLNQRTGALAASLFSRVTDDASGVVGEVGVNRPYARIHEYGGVIEPVNALALRFQINGQWVMVKRVVMPERSYLRSTLAEMSDEIRTRLTAAVAGAA